MIVLSVGMSGSGKTFGMRKGIFASAHSIPIIMIDRMAECNAVPSSLARKTAGVSSVREAREAIRSGARLAIVRDSHSEVADLLDRACHWAIKYPGRAGVACPEAHRAAPCMGKLPKHVEIVATQWRHHAVSLWIDTQRLALLSKTLTEQATLLKLYAINGSRDLSIVRATWGNEAGDAVLACSAKLAAGEPGWHLPLGSVRVPPFAIRRDQ